MEARSGMDTKATAERGITNRTTQPIMVTVADVPEQPAKPAKPTLAAVADSTTSLRVNWTKPDLNGGPEITGYNVEYATGTDRRVDRLGGHRLGGQRHRGHRNHHRAECGHRIRGAGAGGERRAPERLVGALRPVQPQELRAEPGRPVVRRGDGGGSHCRRRDDHARVFGIVGRGRPRRQPRGQDVPGLHDWRRHCHCRGRPGRRPGPRSLRRRLATLALHVDDHSEPFAFSTASTEAGVGTYTWDGAGLDWSSESTVTLRLRETDPPMLSVAPASATEGEAVAFTVTLSPATGRQVTGGPGTSVDRERRHGVRGGPRRPLRRRPGTVDLRGGGDGGRRSTVATAQDAADEDDETFTVTLSNQSPSVVGLGGRHGNGHDPTTTTTCGW